MVMIAMMGVCTDVIVMVLAVLAVVVGVWKVCERKLLMMAKEGGRMFGKYKL